MWRCFGKNDPCALWGYYMYVCIYSHSSPKVQHLFATVFSCLNPNKLLPRNCCRWKA